MKYFMKLSAKFLTRAHNQPDMTPYLQKNIGGVCQRLTFIWCL